MKKNLIQIFAALVLVAVVASGAHAQGGYQSNGAGGGYGTGSNAGPTGCSCA